MLYKNKYRIESARLKNWDYSTPGFYFVTICTDNRQHFFGEIADGRMILSESGKIAKQYWVEIRDQFSFAKMDEFVIMPDHIHGIIQISGSDLSQGDNDISPSPVIRIADTHTGLRRRRDAINRVSTTTTQSADPGGITGKHNPMINPRSLSAIVRWFKGRTSFEINKSSPINAFKWQPRFHDHIIRNEDELFRIRKYIVDNPMNWESDGIQYYAGDPVGSILEHTTREQ